MAYSAESHRVAHAEIQKESITYLAVNIGFDQPRGLNDCRLLTPMPAISEFGRQSLGSKQLRDVAVAFYVKACVTEADRSVPMTALADACEAVAVVGTCDTFCSRNDSIETVLWNKALKSFDRLLQPKYLECIEVKRDLGF